MALARSDINGKDMIGKQQAREIAIEVYHGVPMGWHAEEILAEHAWLGGTYDISGPKATEPGAPDWMPERDAWLQYRETLRRVARGVSAHDPACTELAVRYVELRYIGSYSGYLRATLCRHLKHAVLSPEQKARLHRHFRSLALRAHGTHEYESYLKLWRLFITKQQAQELLESVAQNDLAPKRLPALAEALLTNPLS